MNVKKRLALRIGCLLLGDGLVVDASPTYLYVLVDGLLLRSPS
jgi:hypothetical protein